MAFCTRCGTPRTDGDRTCASCGHEFGQPLSAPPDPYQVYEEPHPTTWDYGLPPDPAPGQQPGGWGYYDEPQRLAPEHADAPQLSQPTPRPPASHRLVEARPATRRRPGLQGTLVAAVGLLVLACGGGAYAVVTSLTSHADNRGGPDAAGPATSAAARSSPLTPSASPASASAGPSATAAPSATSPSGTAPAGTAPSGAAPVGTAPAGGSTTASAGTGQGPGTALVVVSSAAAADPAEPTVLAWLNRYFTAINTHNYQAYVSLLDSQEAANESRSDFTSGFSTTTDSAARLTSISDLSGGGEAATVSFTSHQSAAQSVNGSSCDHWTITIYLEPSGSSYVLVPPPAGYHSSYASC